jgi:TatD DNase family protein
LENQANGLLDSHCHLADEAFIGDLSEVVGRARDAGLEQILCILAAGNQTEYKQAKRLQTIWPNVRFAIGVHPHQAVEYAGRFDEVVRDVREAIEVEPLVRVVGEIGLDYHYDFSPRDVQREVFHRQVTLARELRLPVSIHTREAETDTVAILEEAGRREVRGVFHCFAGDAALADHALALGFHVSFSGMITFKRADALRAIASEVPADRLLIETDAPYLAPVPHRGKRNEPAWVSRVLEVLAEVRGTTVESLSQQVMTNFRALVRP